MDNNSFKTKPVISPSEDYEFIWEFDYANIRSDSLEPSVPYVFIFWMLFMFLVSLWQLFFPDEVSDS